MQASGYAERVASGGNEIPAETGAAMNGSGGRRARRQADRGRRRPRWGRWVAGVLGLLVVVLAVSAVWVVLDARRAEASLRTAVGTVSDLRSDVLGGDVAAVEPALAELQERTGVALSATSGPHWWIAAHTPVVGESVAAVQSMTRVVDGLASDALPALAKAAGVLEPSVLLPRGSQINVRPFIEVSPDIIAADDAAQAAAEEIRRIDTSRLLGPVAGPFAELQEMVDSLAGTTTLASNATQLIPPMFGAYGQRQYILLAQSPAEIRASGGHPGAMILLTADQGKVTMGERLSGGRLYSETPVLPLTEEEELLFTDRLVTFGVDSVLTPDFPRAAEITRAQWARKFGTEVDGVISVDPVALQYILEATGPVRVPDGTVLDGSNAARILLNQIYLEKSIGAQDDFFTDAAEAAFDALLEGTPDVSAMVDALTRAAVEGRFMVWTSDPREEMVLAGTPLSGDLVGEQEGAPVVGVYLNDSSATKMSYYLDYSVTVDRAQCLAGGRRQLAVTLDIASTAPPEAAGFPPYLSGGGQITPGTVMTNILVYSPAWGWIDGVTVDGADYPYVGYYDHEDMNVMQTTITLAPGESRRIEVLLETGGEGQEAPAVLRVTPGSRTPDLLVRDSTC